MGIANKNILITGGTGFVGSHLTEKLLKAKNYLVVTQQTFNPRSYFYTQGFQKKTQIAPCDINKFDQVFDLVTKFDIEYIFHLAAQPLVEVAYYNPRQTFQTNIIGTVNILEAARSFPKIKAVIVASSDKAYGKLNKKQYVETDPLQGDHPYEVSKSAVDLIAQAYYKTYNLPVVVTRFGNIYGEGDLNFSRIIPSIMKSLIKKQILEIRSDGKYVRDYLYVKDVADGYILLAENIEKVKGEAFNFGSTDTFSVLELVALVKQILKQKINYKILNRAKNEIPYQSLDFSKIRNRLGWRPKHKLVNMLKPIFRWYQKALF